MTAKEFRARPSTYFPELGTYEAFCLDEACAHALIMAREDVRGEAEGAGGDRTRTIKGASFDDLRRLQRLGARR